LNEPLAEQIEITVFGPGFGESILIHVGQNHWIIVDSCFDSRTKTPAALTYLKELEIDCSAAVKLVVASHWHDDHIGGISQVLNACSSAQFVCAAALSSREFLGVSTVFNKSPLSKAGSGVGEIQRSFIHCRDRGQPPSFVVGNRTFRINNGATAETLCEITALSPTDHEFSRFLEGIMALMPHRGTTKYRVPSLSPNDISIALWLKIGYENVLLGADLEEHKHQHRGWTAVINSPNRPTGRAGYYKIAHHGSITAHHDGIWTELLRPAPIAVLTPWNRGQKLPSPSDRDRLIALTSKGYATARVKAPARRQLPSVQRILRESGIRVSSAEPETGFVRARKAATSDWQIDHSPNAVPIKDCV
jgi:hypothetical protein